MLEAINGSSVMSIHPHTIFLLTVSLDGCIFMGRLMMDFYQRNGGVIEIPLCKLYANNYRVKQNGCKEE